MPLEEWCGTQSFSRTAGIPSIEKAFCYGSCGWCSDSGSLCFVADKKRNNCWKDEGSCEQTGWNTDRWVSLTTLCGTGAIGCWGTWAAWSFGWEEEPGSFQLTAEPGAFITAGSWLMPELLDGQWAPQTFGMLLALRWAQLVPFGHTQGWGCEPGVPDWIPLVCCPVSLASAMFSGGLKMSGNCVTYSRILSQLPSVGSSEFQHQIHLSSWIFLKHNLSPTFLNLGFHYCDFFGKKNSMFICGFFEE